MTVYNDSFMDNATNVLDLAVGIGNSTGDPFLIGYLILFAFFLIFLAFYSSKSGDYKEGAIVSFFLTAIAAQLLYIAGMVPITAVVLPAIMMFILMIAYYVIGV